MDALQIQDLRAMLAAQTALEKRPPSLACKLQRLLSPKPSPVASAPLYLSAEAAVAPSTDPREMDEDRPVTLSDDVVRLAGEPVPSQMLLGDLGPRRSAFGQRAEAVLDLSESVPVEPQRLTLLAADGAAVGEIILHAGDVGLAKAVEGRRHFEPLHSEVPFFPDDLADEPERRRAAAPETITPPSSPPPELAATFLLATLAARLACEEALLRRRLSAARSVSAAA